MKVAKAKGRLRGKQPKLSRTRPSTCWSCTTQRATPKVSLLSSSASGDLRSTGPSSECDSSRQNWRDLLHISRILRRVTGARRPARPTSLASKYRERPRRDSQRRVSCGTVSGSMAPAPRHRAEPVHEGCRTHCLQGRRVPPTTRHAARHRPAEHRGKGDVRLLRFDRPDGSQDGVCSCLPSPRGHTERIGHFVGCRPGQGRRTKNRPPGNLRSVGKAGSFGGSRAGQRDSDFPSAPCLRQVRMPLGPRSATDPVAETGAAAPAPLDGRASRAATMAAAAFQRWGWERDAAEGVLG
jgi:hypothetical protein